MIIIFYTITQVVLIKTQPVINCTENSFDIGLISTNVEYTFVNITYSIKISNNIQILNQQDYICACFKSVIFKYKPINSNENEMIAEFNYNGSLTSSIRFSNLSYLTQYQFRISYKQFVNTLNKLKEYEIDRLRNHTVYTCFGRPGFAENFKPNTLHFLSLFSNGSRISKKSIEATWEKPLEINAPDICYYQYALVDNKNYNFITNKMTNYKIEALNLSSNSTFYFAVFNDVSCYISKYPFVKDCKYTKLNSKFFVYKNVELGVGDSSTIIEYIDSLDLNTLEQSVTTIPPSTTTKSSVIRPSNDALKPKESILTIVFINLGVLAYLEYLFIN